MSPRPLPWFLASLVLGFLALPILSGVAGFPTREQVYRGTDRRENLSWFVYHHLFREKSPLDIAILGSSHLAAGLDALTLERLLTERLGRPATVIVLPAFFRAVDLQFLLLEDLLRQRRVRMVVVDPGTDTQVNPNPHLYRILQWGHPAEVWGSLPAGEYLRWYALTCYSTPRQLLAALFPRPILPPEARYTARNGSTFDAQTPLPDWLLRRASAGPASLEEVSYPPERYAELYFAPILSSYQHFCLRHFIELAVRNETVPVVVRFPFLERARERELTLPEGLRSTLSEARVTVLGITPAALFEGLDDRTVASLYADPVHFNAAGSHLHTAIIAPALVEEYARQYR